MGEERVDLLGRGADWSLRPSDGAARTPRAPRRARPDPSRRHRPGAASSRSVRSCEELHVLRTHGVEARVARPGVPGTQRRAASSKARRVRSKQLRTTARKSSFFVPNSWKTYGCETPTRRAIASVEAPTRPPVANSWSRPRRSRRVVRPPTSGCRVRRRPGRISRRAVDGVDVDAMARNLAISK